MQQDVRKILIYSDSFIYIYKNPTVQREGILPLHGRAVYRGQIAWDLRVKERTAIADI